MELSFSRAEEFTPHPSGDKLLRLHTVEFEKARRRDWGGAENTEPRRGFAAKYLTKTEIYPDRRANGEAAAEELTKGQAEKQAFVIFLDFLVYSYFHGVHLSGSDFLVCLG